ncbi:MAG: AMP-dependent synthetase [Rickettsiales bacterium]|jgi:long-chain acyl-CoA synthetase|nr:AMP-dependent synthetase [Rickettsiales bacterium]
MAPRKKKEPTAEQATHPWRDIYANTGGKIRWDMDIPVEPLYAVLDEAVRTYPTRIAIDFLGKTMRYAELGQQVAQLTKGLQEIGVKRGVKVGLMLPNCPYYIIAYFAILKAGGTVVNINPLYTVRELQHQIEDSDTQIIVTLNLQALHGKVAKLLNTTPLQKIIIAPFEKSLPFPKNFLFPILKRDVIASAISYGRVNIAWDTLLANDGKYTPVHLDPLIDVALLQYSGGTTGTPKGAILTHYNLYANMTQCRAALYPIEDGKHTMLAVLPFFHVFAMTANMNIGLIKGMTLLLHPKFDVEAVLKDIAKKKPSIFAAVPTMLVAFNNHPDIAKYDLTSLALTVTGGAGLPPAVKAGFEALTKSPVVEGYGLTENSPVATLNPLFAENRAGSIGIPLPQVTVEISDLKDKEKMLPLGETGEVCISGPQVMAGYWNPKEGMDSPIIEGRLHTGDIGFIDKDGYVHIVDRLKDMIICGGFNIYPRNLEDAIMEHSAVKEAAVIGIADPYKGEIPKAFITCKTDMSISAEDLQKFLSGKLAKMYLPGQIEFRDELPKTMIGKVDRKALREQTMNPLA